MKAQAFESPGANGTLRDYQRTLADNIFEQLGGGTRKLIAQMPTGAGKSVLAVEVVARVLRAGKRVLFIAHRAELILQFSGI